MTLVAVDVHYEQQTARAGCAVFASWSDAEPLAEHVVSVACEEPYVPGSLYRRELPAILAAVGRVRSNPRAIVVDGYVWLDRVRTRPGLGAHVFDTLEQRCAVIGVAKNPFAGSGAREVVRGDSARPLYVTAVGIDEARAADAIASMHGPHRVPTLLLRADHLARGR